MNESQILAALIESGKIQQSDVDAIVEKEEWEVQSIATMLHSITCTRGHITLEELALGMAGCCFYAEEKMEYPWKANSHINHYKAATKIIEVFGVDEDIDKICYAVGLSSRFGSVLREIYLTATTDVPF